MEKEDMTARIICIILSLVVICPACYWLWDEECDAALATRGLREGRACTLELGDNSKVDEANNGKLVHATGTATTADTLHDTEFGISHQGIRLIRVVQYYQWVQTTHSSGRKKNRHTTYHYGKEWVGSPVDSSKFKYKAGHENTVPVTVPDADWAAPNVSFGAYTLHPSQVRAIGNKKTSSLGKYRIPENLQGRAKVDGCFLYIGPGAQAAEGAGPNTCTVDPANPRIGDVRIKWVFVGPGETVSFLARQQGRSFEPYVADRNGYVINILAMGNRTAGEMYGEAGTDVDLLDWLVRVGCWILITLGSLILAAPFRSWLEDRLPYLGGFQIHLLLAATGTSITLVVIGFAWMENLVEYLCILLGVLGYIAWLLVRDKRKAAKIPAALDSLRD